MEPLEPDSLRRDLSAFADGELDAAAADLLLRHMERDPAAVEALRRLQQMKAAARRAVRAQTPPPSEALRERLQRMISTDAPEAGPTAAPRQPMRIGWSVLTQALAAAILLALGIWIGRELTRPQEANRLPSGSDSNTADGTGADVLPAAVIAQAEEIHGFCSRLSEGLHEAGYPADIAPLAASVERDLHSDHPYPNLTPIGYRYRGAGPCGKPLPNTAHLLYRQIRPGSFRAISVFVQAWSDQYQLKPDRLYTVSVATSPFPMLAWRTDRVVYFLLADDEPTERAAAALIRGTPTTSPESQELSETK